MTRDQFHALHLDHGYRIDSRCLTCFPSGPTEAAWQAAVVAAGGHTWVSATAAEAAEDAALVTP